MRNKSRLLDRAALLALIALVYFVARGWEHVRREHEKTFNILAATDVHYPTADLFLWAFSAVVLFLGTKMWAHLAPHVFQLSEDRAEVWRNRLRLARLTTTLVFLGLALSMLYRYGYNFREAFSY